jgi:protein-L-isoaspartate(D-aspartate) O-methyltransferase
MPSFTQQRQLMVETQLKTRDITDQQVLQAMPKVLREKFIPSGYKEQAYSDSPIPIGHGQTISQPYIVAKMCQLLELKPTDKILEIGAGSGYQAAILAEIVEQVIGIEIVPELAEKARKTLEKLGYQNVKIITGDGKKGYAKQAPYNGIIAAAAAAKIPPAWKDQLKTGGKIVAPIKQRLGQRLVIYTKQENGWKQELDSGVAFVPLV